MSQQQVFLQRMEDRSFIREYLPNQEACCLCGLVIQQDDATRRWYYEEDASMGERYCLTFCDSLDSFETQEGWVCSTDCLHDHCVDAGMEDVA